MTLKSPHLKRAGSFLLSSALWSCGLVNSMLSNPDFSREVIYRDFHMKSPRILKTLPRLQKACLQYNVAQVPQLQIIPHKHLLFCLVYLKCPRDLEVNGKAPKQCFGEEVRMGEGSSGELEVRTPDWGGYSWAPRRGSSWFLTIAGPWGLTGCFPSESAPSPTPKNWPNT